MSRLSHAVQTWRLIVRGEMALESIGIEGQRCCAITAS